MRNLRLVPSLVVVVAGLAVVGCGSSSKPSAGGSPTPTASTATPAGAGSSASPAPLAAEAQSAATGDIPDTQVFLTLRDPKAGFQISYPEGWAQRGAGNAITIQDKNNLIRVTVGTGSPPTPAGVTAQLRGSGPGNLTITQAGTLTISGAPVVKVSYTTLSQPNPVTGKRVQLLVDRYVYSRAGKVATVDLGTAKGVDNVDAYKMISRSFRWL